MPLRVRLRHEVERAAAVATTVEELIERLRDADVLVRYGVERPGEVTGYARRLRRALHRERGPILYGDGELSSGEWSSSSGARARSATLA